jgi:aspartate aminotransferase
MDYAKRAKRLEPERAFSMLERISTMVAAGRNIIGFHIGEPDFATPENIKTAACSSIHANRTHYSPPSGVPELRIAIADYMSKTRGMQISPEQVVVSAGTKLAIFCAIMSCVESGADVLGPVPTYPAYPSIVNMIGANYVPIPLIETDSGFRMDLDRLANAVTPNASMIVLNSPHNPTGALLPREDLERIAEIATEHDLWVLSDEIYSRLVYDGSFASILSLPGMADRTIVVDGFSKAYAMTGWRLGFAVVNRTLAGLLDTFMANVHSCTATFTQYAGIEALTGPQYEVEKMRLKFVKRRDLIVTELNSIPGFRCHLPAGAFYAFPNVTEACRIAGLPDADRLQDDLLERAGVAVLSMTAFNAQRDPEADQYVRISYATGEREILEGTRRIRDFMSARVGLRFHRD